MKNRLAVLYITLLFQLIVVQNGFANVAPPGIWNAGHGSIPHAIFLSDTSLVDNIQMKEELVLVNIYKSFAVVKGRYMFRNLSDKSFKIRLGYPINGENNQSIVETVRYDDLYHLQVKIDGKPTEVFSLDDLADSLVDLKQIGFSDAGNYADNWYFWNCSFSKHSTVIVEVYFIVNTSAFFTKGYEKKEGNAFYYILHTGSSWHDHIEEGNILINLKEDISLDDIYGIIPDTNIYADRSQLIYRLKNFKPTEKDNLLIWYRGMNDSASSYKNKDQLYLAIDSTDLSILSKEKLVPFSKQDFSTPVADGEIILIVSVVIGLILFVGLIYLLIRTIKKFIRFIKRIN